MSLTSHLADSTSPVRQWFDEQLGATREIVSYGNDTLCGKPRAACALPMPPGCDSSLSGTGIDYLLRAILRHDALRQTVATHGAFLIDGPHAGTASRIEQEAVARIEALRPSETTLSRAELQALSLSCLVLARFEQYYRARATVWEHVGAQLHDHPSFEAYAQRVVPEACVQDLSAIAPALADDYADLRQAQTLRLNPVFDLSLALGGADADLIADGALWDLKSSANATQIIRRAELWQIVGYALADTADAYSITSVGILAARRHTRVAWPLEDLLAALSGKSRPIQQWRREFASVAEKAALGRLLPSGRARLVANPAKRA